MRTERMWSEDTQREIDYFVCDDWRRSSTSPTWGHPAARLGQPGGHARTADWCILDLDPKEAPFTHVVTVARAIKQLCDGIELPCFIKTSGSTGLHVLLPSAASAPTSRRARWVGCSRG